MAKAKVRGLEDELNRVFSRYESNLKKAMQEAAEEAEFDIRMEAESCLYRYYENFQPGVGEPNSYRRTESLINAFAPYNNITKQKWNNSMVAEVGIGYDASKLDGVYYSNSVEKYQPVDGSWVLNNYLEGIHPTTDGGIVYIEVRDPVSPEDHMYSFLEKYTETFKTNVLQSFVNKVIKGR